MNCYNVSTKIAGQQYFITETDDRMNEGYY